MVGPRKQLLRSLPNLASKVSLEGRWQRTLVTAAIENQPQDVLEYNSAKPFKDMPGPSYIKAIWPFLKDPSLKLRMDQVFKDFFKEYGPILKFKVPGLPTQVMIKDPKDTQKLLSLENKNPIQPGFDFWVFYRNQLKKDIFTETGGLIGNHGEEWWRVRSLVQQDMLRPKSAMFYLSSIEEISLELADKMGDTLDDKSEIDDMMSLLARWALEAVTSIFLDTRLNCLAEDHQPNSDTMRLIENVNVILGPDAMEMAGGVPIWKYISMPYYKRFDAASTEVFEICKRLTEKAVKEMQASEDKPVEEMSVLEKMIKRTGPDSQIPAVMAMDAIAAGIDTTSSTSAFLLYDLAINQDVQAKLYKEIVEVVGSTEVVTEAKLKRMRYLKACLHESQRMHPAVMGSGRETQQEMVLGGFQIPKGIRVNAMGILTMMEESHFAEPNQFKPERWLRGCPEHHTAHPFAAIPFSFGPRMCIGRRFAELEVQVLVVKLLQRFKLEYYHEPVGLITPFVVKPDRKIKMKFSSRI